MVAYLGQWQLSSFQITQLFQCRFHFLNSLKYPKIAISCLFVVSFSCFQFKIFCLSRADLDLGKNISCKERNLTQEMRYVNIGVDWKTNGWFRRIYQSPIFSLIAFDPHRVFLLVENLLGLCLAFTSFQVRCETSFPYFK